MAYLIGCLIALQSQINQIRRFFRCLSNTAFSYTPAFASAFGTDGTLLGLVNMLYAMGGANFEVIGGSLGLALITTLYGIVLANLLLRPIAIKLGCRTEPRAILMHMVLEGISMLGQNRNPSFIRETLNSFVTQYRGGERAASKVERRNLPTPLDWGDEDDRRDPDTSSWVII